MGGPSDEHQRHQQAQQRTQVLRRRILSDPYLSAQAIQQSLRLTERLQDAHAYYPQLLRDVMNPEYMHGRSERDALLAYRVWARRVGHMDPEYMHGRSEHDALISYHIWARRVGQEPNMSDLQASRARARMVNDRVSTDAIRAELGGRILRGESVGEWFTTDPATTAALDAKAIGVADWVRATRPPYE